MYYNKNTHSIYYEKFGNGGKNILILPGWGDTRETFRLMIENLKLNYTVYIFDYPGFGRSIFPDEDLTIYDYTNIIRDFIKDENIQNPTIISHSFGGRIATLMAGYYKDNIDKLILIDAAGIKRGKNIFKLIKQTTYKLLRKLQVIVPKKKRNLYIKRLINAFGSSDYKTLGDDMRKTFKNVINEDLRYYIKNIDVKTLIIWGKKDKDTPFKDAKYMKNNIEDSLLVTLKDAGHFSYLNYPTLVNKIINDFLKKDGL